MREMIKIKDFKTSQEGIEFWEQFNGPWGTTWRMSNYWWNKLNKAWELWSEDKDPVYKKKNEIMWDMFSDREDVISRIDWELHCLSIGRYTEQEKVEHLNGMLEEYWWYLQW